MTWIRSPLFDCVWFLSAPVLGLLMLVPLAVPMPTLYLTAGLLALNFAHALAPIALAWSHDGYRTMMLRQPGKFIGVPALVVAAGLAAALGTWWLFPHFRLGPMILERVQFANLTVPIVVWANLYALWNLYHGGAQNFGFLSLYLRRSFKGRDRLLALGGCLAVTIFVGHEAPRLFGVAVFLFTTGLVTVNHSMAAIGIAAHVYARHNGCSPLWFIFGVLAAGGLLFALFSVSFVVSMRAAIMALCLRGALGIWHFLQDRWVWQLSKPEVRSTIGADIFRRPA